MNQQVVFTIISKDKPGIIASISKIVNEHGGNWLNSRMSQLAGEFAGIAHIEIAINKKKELENSLLSLKKQGVFITLRQSGNKFLTTDYKLHEIEIFGNDRFGIVADISKLFSEKNINIMEFETDINNAPIAGGMLFSANAVIAVNNATNLDELQDKLHELADKLALDIEWTSSL